MTKPVHSRDPTATGWPAQPVAGEGVVPPIDLARFYEILGDDDRETAMQLVHLFKDHFAGLMRAIDAQVRAIVDQLSPGNCEQYLDLPDAVRVGTLRRIAQSPVLPIQLERAS